MATLEELLSGNETEWINALPTYQRSTINALIEQGKTPEEVALVWLSANGPTNTFPFGTTKNSSIFYQKLIEEVEAFFCKEDRYVDDKRKLLTGAEATQTVIVSTLSVAIAPIVHASAPYIAPAVALTLITIAKLGRNAWCATRREQKTNEPNK